MLRLALAALVALALLVASCGDDDDGEAPVDDVYFGALEIRPVSGGGPGLEVVRVEPNSPVSSSGLKRGAVITAVNGARVDDPAALSGLLAELGETHDAGDKVVISTDTGSAPGTFTVRLAANVYLGAQLLAAAGSDRGARVGGVPSDTPADAAGLQRDDLITAVDGEPVSSSKALIQALAEHQPGDEVELTLSRGSTEMSATVTLEPRG